MRQDIPDPWSTAMTKANVLGRSGRPSYRAITERTGLAQETVRRLFLGIGESDADTIRRVAEVLKVDPTVVTQWNGRARETVAPYQPPAEADLLNERQRRALDELIRSMAVRSIDTVTPLFAEKSELPPLNVIYADQGAPSSPDAFRPDLLIRTQGEGAVGSVFLLELKPPHHGSEAAALGQVVDYLRDAGFHVEAQTRSAAVHMAEPSLAEAARPGQPEHALKIAASEGVDPLPGDEDLP